MDPSEVELDALVVSVTPSPELAPAPGAAPEPPALAPVEVVDVMFAEVAPPLLLSSKVDEWGGAEQ